MPPEPPTHVNTTGGARAVAAGVHGPAGHDLTEPHVLFPCLLKGSILPAQRGPCASGDGGGGR